MTHVVLVEFDELLRGALGDLLADAGYAVTQIDTERAALDALTRDGEGVVLVCSNRDADHHLTAGLFAAVAADARLAARHRYILLSTNPAAIPAALRAHLTDLNVPILPKPFDADVLLATVRDVATRHAPEVAPTGKRPPALPMRGTMRLQRRKHE
jgi:DNA-binding response OmpR family regulator